MGSRIILHSDMNCFYAACECLYHPEFAGRPLAVAGNPENRHGIILAKNQLAKEAGVKTGEANWEALNKCPDMVLVPPNYKLYQRFSRKARDIYYRYSDQVEPFGLDEAWIDVTKSTKLFGDGMDMAKAISNAVKSELGLTVSIGVSWNKIFAKFGSDYKKPDAITQITPDNYKEIVWPQPVGDLLYVGRRTERKLANIGIFTVGALARIDPDILKRRFGKVGPMLWTFANGFESSHVKEFDSQSMDTTRVIKGIGNSMTTPRDLVTINDVKIVLSLLAESVAMRLREAGFLAKEVTIYVRTKDLLGCSRQLTLKRPTDLTREIIAAAIDLFQNHYHYESPIRSMGIRVGQLMPKDMPIQLNFFEDPINIERQKCLDSAIDGLRSRFGNNIIQRAIIIGDEMSHLDIKKENVIHPVGFLSEKIPG